MKRPGSILFLLAVLLIFPLKASFANTITVDTTADEFDMVANNTCSLREAVQTYNSGADFGGCSEVPDVNPNTIDFAVPADTYVLDIPNSGGNVDDNSRGDIDICADIVFNGGGIGVTVIQAQFPALDPDRVFHIHQPFAICEAPSGQDSPPTASGPPTPYFVVFNGVTITGGLHQGPDFQGFLLGGGGIFNLGDLTVNDSEITDNRADNSQNPQDLVMGGGILALGPAQINRSLINTNSIMSVDTDNNGALGGGIAGTVADLQVSCGIQVANTNIYDNVVENGSGGGVGDLDCFFIEILMSALYDNHVVGSDGSPVGPVDYGSGGGAGIFYDLCPICEFNLVDSTLSGNTAIKHGGGISLSDQYQQTISTNVIQLNSSTIASNVADADGNGMGDGGGFFISRETVMGSLFEFQNTIVADNAAVMGVDCFDESPNIDPVSVGYNLVRDPTGCNISGPQTGDLPAGFDPSLAPLANNGGLTLTRALRFDSEAIDMANPAGCEDAVASGVNLLFDQRDDPFNRVEPGSAGAVPRCDVGAYEFRTVEIVTEKQVSDAVVQVGDTFTYTIVITNNGPGDATGVMIDDPLPAQVSFVSFGSISQGTCNQAAGVITCDLGNLAVNGVATVEVNVQAVAESNAVTNTATVMTNETPPQNPQATNQIIGGICVTGSGPIWNTIRPACANCSLNPQAFSLGFWRDYGSYLILGFLVAAVLAFRRKKVRG